MKSIVFSLFLQLIILNISETVAECTGGGGTYTCKGGRLSDLDAISSDAGRILIEDMRVGKLSSNLLHRFSNLQVFQCSNCGLTEIDYAPFKSSPELEQLMLKNNELTRIRGDWFVGLGILTLLDLSWNKIKNIESGDFGNVTTLNDLWLSGNPLDCVDPNALADMTELVSFKLADIPNFGCPKAVINFAKSKGLEFEQDNKWDLNQNEKIYVTEAPQTTAKTTPTKPSKIETLAPDMVSEEVYIPTLTTLALPKPPAVVETTTPINIEMTVTVPTEVPSNIINVTADLSPVTQETILVTASKLPEIYVTPEATRPPIIGLPVEPTSGEKPIVPPVVGITKTDNTTKNPPQSQSGTTESLHNGGSRANIINECFLTIFIVAFYFGSL